MSIPAQGCRSVLFPPPGVKIRRTIQTFDLPHEPTLIAERHPQRVLVSVLLDSVVGVSVYFAGSASSLLTTPVGVIYSEPPPVFWGPEEVWAACFFPDSPAGANILVQSVFYD